MAILFAPEGTGDRTGIGESLLRLLAFGLCNFGRVSENPARTLAK